MPEKPSFTRTSGQITETVDGFRRTLTLTMPYDQRHSNPNRDYGIHGMDLKMVLHKDNLAVQFVASLPVYLPHVARELASKGNIGYCPFEGMGTNVGYHDDRPHYEGQPEMDCDILEGGKCYHDGSSLRAEEWYTEFLKGGPDVIWAKLEAEWNKMAEPASETE